MKKIISILLGICLCGGVFAQTQLKIISFNIHVGYDALSPTSLLSLRNKIPISWLCRK